MTCEKIDDTFRRESLCVFHAQELWRFRKQLVIDVVHGCCARSDSGAADQTAAGTVQPHASALCGKKPIIAFSFSKDRLRVVMPRLLSGWKKPLRKDSFVALRADGTAGMVL
jgi:hypothetical protein